jgi:hypothetical protein
MDDPSDATAPNDSVAWLPGWPPSRNLRGEIEWQLRRQRRRSDAGCARALSKRARYEFECILSPDVHSFCATEAMSLLVLRSDGGIDLS